MTLDESLKDAFIATKASRRGSGSVAGGGGGPQFPDMEARLSKLEDGLNDVKLVLARIEPVLAGLATRSDIVRIEGTLTALDAKIAVVDSKVATVDAKVAALDARVGRVEISVGTALTTAVGKAIGPVQFITIVAGSAAVLSVLATLYSWFIHQPWFPH